MKTIVSGNIKNLTYLQKVNQENIEKQDQRNVDNLVKFKELGDNMKSLKAMEANYNSFKIAETIANSEAFLAEYGVGGTIDRSA